MAAKAIGYVITGFGTVRNLTIMRARLAIEQGEGAPRVIYLEPGKTVTLGRSRDNDVVLHDEHASRQHAQIESKDGLCVLRDLSTLNGTFVNGEKITQPFPLQHGQLIGIADMRFCFEVVEGDPIDHQQEPPTPMNRVDRSGLWADDLAVLYDFVTATAEETDSVILIERTLETIAQCTGAAVCGFLNLDPEEPLEKLVYPQSAQVDAHLSRQMTQQVQKTGRTMWLRECAEWSPTDSLASYFDAICLPLKAHGTVLGALHAYKRQGVFSARDRRFCELVGGHSASTLTRLRWFRNLKAENSRLRQQAPLSDELVGDSQAMQSLRGLIARAAASHATVLIHGETGAGKELVALALHRQSPRRHGPLVVANCGAVTEHLFESQFFGHVKGAFTGAFANHDGYFKQADDGTLFLDEIGEIPLESQVKLLRAIETKTVRAVGDTKDLRTDVRVLAATNRDLEKEVKNGAFRQDLFFRLCVVQIPVPPLREHAEDIPALVDHFLHLLTNPGGRIKKPTTAAMNRLQEYHWPGNVRQLRAVLENAIIMGEGPNIDVCDLILPDIRLERKPGAMTLAEIEAWGIACTLERTEGNISQAAKILDIGRDTLGRKIKEYNLSRYLKDDQGKS
jgi:two-component system response regulator HydG